MRIALSIPIRDGGDWGHALQFASEAELMGAASLWSREAWGYDAVTPLAFLAARTSTIGLGTGIMQIGSRSPANVAMTATTLNSLSGGRFMLGLGTSGPQVIEGWHGIPFDRPIQRTRELIEIVRLATSGEQVAYEGEIYHLPLPGGEGRALRSAAGASHVPIYIAALGPRNLELTGELADGWMGGSFIPETAEVFIQHIRSGAEKSCRDLENFEIHIPLSVEFTDDVDEAAKRHARGYGFTFGAMGSERNNFYKNAFARQGFADEVNLVQRLWREGRRDEARDQVPTELALKANLIGTPEMVRERLRVYRDAGVTTIRAGLAGDGPEAQMDTLGQLMSLVNEVDAESVSAS
ncbi:MAG TPA: F420-dependent methylene-tetrahydromethanopterin reductase [Dehalococcoidia bacterium]|nr:F420-dependent methylene-tetrahydromethanopterin reductase [Dehalococcoidia bacterium]